MLQKILDMGIPYMENNKECFGTLYVIYKIVYPKTLDNLETLDNPKTLDKVETIESNENDSYNSYECEFDELFSSE
jgi:DnaJ-class molecular chaperone